MSLGYYMQRGMQLLLASPNLLLSFPFDVIRKRGERRFFRDHDHQQVIDRYPDSIDKIIVFNNLGSLIDIDARAAKGFAEDPPVIEPWRYLAVDPESYRAHMRNEVFRELISGLDHIIKSEERWMYSFDIPPEGMPNPQFREGERWLADYEATYHGGKDWHNFYSGMKMIADSRCMNQLIQHTDALLGFYCKGCDTPYEPGQMDWKQVFWSDGLYGRGEVHPFCPEGHDLETRKLYGMKVVE